MHPFFLAPYYFHQSIFQPITTPSKLFIHRIYRTVIGRLQPITLSFTYHYSEGEPIYPLLGFILTTLYTFPRLVCTEGTLFFCKILPN